MNWIVSISFTLVDERLNFVPICSVGKTLPGTRCIGVWQRQQICRQYAVHYRTSRGHTGHAKRMILVHMTQLLTEHEVIPTSRYVTHQWLWLTIIKTWEEWTRLTCCAQSMILTVNQGSGGIVYFLQCWNYIGKRICDLLWPEWQNSIQGIKKELR